MDKKRLNDEIILCRPAVRRAKVAVIRKLLKKMKILKSCKVEAVKEKKLKKSERMFKRVQVMKKVKDDEVTKFALRHTDIEAFLKGPKLNLRQSALAHLAKHQAVAKKVNFIRDQVQNWEMELPVLLDSLGKRKKKVANMQETDKNSFKTTKINAKVTKEDSSDGKIKKSVSLGELGVKEDRTATRVANQSLRINSDGGMNSGKTEKVETVKKIEDPFFIGKKIVAPKLMLDSTSNKNSNKLGKLDVPLWERQNSSSVFHSRASRGRRNSNEFKAQKPLPVVEEEKLHPSWAAKKVKLIKPFQGKKITFSDD